MRAGSLSNDQIIDLLNGYFVPVYIPLHHYGYGEAHSPLYFEKPVVIPAAEKDEMWRIWNAFSDDHLEQTESLAVQLVQ